MLIRFGFFLIKLVLINKIVVIELNLYFYF
jgi:hypothetical protein